MDNTTNDNRPLDKGYKEKVPVFYSIYFSVVGVAIIVLIVINLVVFLRPKHEASPAPTSADTNTEIHDGRNVFDIAFNDLNKSQTIEAFKLMHEPGYTPSGFADSALALNSNETNLSLDYSYDSLSDIPTLDYYVSNFGKNDLDIVPVGDYYAVISTSNYKEKRSPAYWPKAVSFNKKYVDYNKQMTNSGMNDVIIFTDVSSSVVRKTLPVFASTNLMTQLNSIFSYDFVESDEKYELTMNCIGISLDAEAYMDMFYSSKEPTELTDYPYTITHYRATIELDKNTGIPSWVKSGSGGTSELIESFRLDAQEIYELEEYLDLNQ